jgi:hypothetical protein
VTPIEVIATALAIGWICFAVQMSRINRRGRMAKISGTGHGLCAANERPASAYRTPADMASSETVVPATLGPRFGVLPGPHRCNPPATCQEWSKVAKPELPPLSALWRCQDCGKVYICTQALAHTGLYWSDLSVSIKDWIAAGGRE